MGNEADNRAQSEFNMAVSYLGRLNTLFYVCNEASMELDIFKWYHSLRTLIRELSTEMNDTESKEIKSLSQEVSNKVNEQISTQSSGDNFEVPAELYEALDKLEMTIRMVLKRSGLQNKMQDEAMSALK
jgi:hypothetical protein